MPDDSGNAIVKENTMTEIIFKEKTYSNLEALEMFLMAVAEAANLKVVNNVLSEKIVNLQADKLELTRMCLNK
jgi:hypothetical protein